MSYHEFILTAHDEDIKEFTFQGFPYLTARSEPVANIDDDSVWAVGQWYDGWYQAIRAPLIFTTSTIPSGATIEYAVFSFSYSYDQSITDDFDIIIQNGQPTYPSHPPVREDYNLLYYSGDGGSINTLNLPKPALIELNATGKTWIQKGAGALTKLMLRSSRDIGAVPPTGREYVMWTASPKLIVRITVTKIVAVTNFPTNVTEGGSVTFNGEITNLGGWINSYGFEWKEGIDGEIYSIQVGAAYQGVTTFYYNKSGLSWPTYFRAWGENEAGKSYGDWVGIGEEIINVKAELNSVFARVLLYGELLNPLLVLTIIERGFEYKIRDTEPAAEDTGTEVKETNANGFAIGEYSLKNKELYDQQYISDNIIWWFRAYCKDDGDNRYVATSWMKNLPNVITQDMTNINYNKADGNGIVISEGASELTMRGFEVIHEFSDRLPDSWRFEIGGFEGEPESVAIYAAGSTTHIIDFIWQGTLTKTVYQTYALTIGAYSITIGRMLFGWPIMDDCLVEGKNYKCKAFAENEFGRVYGEEVDFSTWPRTYFSENPPTIGELTIVKNEIIENLPVGVTASRRGFRYGTTETADEFDVHENGSFTNGPYSMMLVDLLPDTTYYIYAYIIVEGIVYEGALETITTDPEDTEDSDEYPTPHFSPHGQDYREIETKVFAEVLASIGIIEFSGGKKTLPITNHLIQTNPNAKTIADRYLDRFKLAKTRMTVTFPTPLPFEREDTVDFSYGALLFKENDKGVVHFKEDGAGVSVLMGQISMIIKKINSVGLDKTETSVDYTAVLDLEHE